MSLLFLLIALWHLFVPTSVWGFTPSLRDVYSAFLTTPYNIIFTNSQRTGEVDSSLYDDKEGFEKLVSSAEKEEGTVTFAQPKSEEEMKGQSAETGNVLVDRDTIYQEKETLMKDANTNEKETTMKDANTGEKETTMKDANTVEKETTMKDANTVEKETTMKESDSGEEKLMKKKTEEKEPEGTLRNVRKALEKKKHNFFSKMYSNHGGRKKMKKEKSNDITKKKDINKLPTTFLLPGVGGSTLIIQYENALIPSCSNDVLNSKPFRMWVSLPRLFSLTSNVYCLFDTLRLTYNSEKKIYQNQTGVKVTVENYGYLKGVEYLDYINNVGIGVTGYYNDVSSHFVSNGYVDGESIIGAPYDWRYPLYQQDYKLFKESIETAYEKRNGMKVNLMGHSLGGLFINYFLTHLVDKEWKTKYLNAILYMSSPFKGTVKTIRALLHGNRDSVSFKITSLIRISISDTMMKAIGNSMGSLFDLIPYKEYYEHDQVVILINTDTTPIDENYMQQVVMSCGIYNRECYLNRSDVKLKVYTLSDWHELLNDDLMEKYNNHKPHREIDFSVDHGVPIYCVYSSLNKKNTDYMLFFQKEDLKEPIIYHGNGDGTVPLESLAACSNFYNAKEIKYFENYTHIGILHNAEVVKYVYNVLQLPEDNEKLSIETSEFIAAE
ncbi:phosphatidylcholine-sterol acyltransferase precursor [Plasmodium gonderi]|uniref:Phosphatidylcholine-sterol acyltransferase n=1 Tax=Plasmodium gonderi TaxID=77519 RepID=A0A1Y1JJB3_PLAGO|nr:phosphatidylcholine-sterol acyltransferase precursor [Plasmodium gonderi]GAW81738.1 phosphatidylcholine-sterol acyltransferase precursor [Plasmodium gonderi]